jgi:hypothetical protein
MRARNIKPDFFKNEELGELDALTRLLFVGLWCYCDRDGFFELRIKKIKAEIFPYEEITADNLEKKLLSLVRSGFVLVYTPTEKTMLEEMPVKNKIVQILNFTKHQTPHRNEKQSILKGIIKTCVLGPKHLLPKTDPLLPERGMRNDDIMKEERGKRKENVLYSRKNETLSENFETVWKTYPIRKEKSKAFDEYKKLKPDKLLHEKIILEIKRQIDYKFECDNSHPVKFCPEFPYLGRWLKNKRWEDQMPKTKAEIEEEKEKAAEEYYQKYKIEL